MRGEYFIVNIWESSNLRQTSSHSNNDGSGGLEVGCEALAGGSLEGLNLGELDRNL